MNTKKITRLEVIGADDIGQGFNGRLFVEHNCKIETSLQDNGRTLKVFIKKGAKE